MGAVTAGRIAAPSLFFGDSLPAPQPATALWYRTVVWLDGKVIDNAPRTTRTRLTCWFTGRL